ncbi:type II toxin-antitoxin system antitoxin DNA ADP-ribosyl glycohydrolase DarG [Rhodovulum strictum]|uniref:Appr-1-p processing protein n=1 Tax=Rhodovulum strictum TaxID=58314 RepID=A0A844BCK6_9RHOB|nr:macro domain-containing protein [Rhodovulum strictum]MRH22194.1 Appr-1-p processing protein [Rhodovulum strictum]
MFEYKTGDILAEDAEALVNTVNCVGVMGRGVALQFKNAFPSNFEEYARACKRDEVRPGHMFVVETGQLTSPRYIINFPTKRHWRGKSRMEDIEAGLRDLQRVIREKNIRSIAIPPLGSGLGGLNWKEVRPRIEEALRGFNNVRVVIFEPNGAPDTNQMAKRKTAPNMTPGRAALVGLMNRYLSGLLDPFVTLLEVHKLMYFMKVSGEGSLERLRVVKGPYGPYAENLTHVLREIEGYFISGYRDGGDAPNKQLEIVPGAVRDADSFLREHPDTHSRFDRVADLVAGFETPFGLELLSTVHWVVTTEHPRTMDELTGHVYAWNDRKKQFSPRQIGIAFQTLQSKGWFANA